MNKTISKFKDSFSKKFKLGKYNPNVIAAKEKLRKKDIQIHNLNDKCEHESVDLGLSVRWATCNVGAASPEDYGSYFVWAETEEKIYYSKDTFQNQPIQVRINEEGIINLLDINDAATIKWGKGWRMPTNKEIFELIHCCKWEWCQMNGISGYRIIGSNGNSIFLPAAGFVCDDPGNETDEEKFGGWYWSANGIQKHGGHSLFFGPKIIDCGNFGWQEVGRPIRPVTKQSDEIKKENFSEEDQRESAIHHLAQTDWDEIEKLGGCAHDILSKFVGELSASGKSNLIDKDYLKAHIIELIFLCSVLGDFFKDTDGRGYAKRFNLGDYAFGNFRLCHNLYSLSDYVYEEAFITYGQKRLKKYAEEYDIMKHSRFSLPSDILMLVIYPGETTLEDVYYPDNPLTIEESMKLWAIVEECVSEHLK